MELVLQILFSLCWKFLCQHIRVLKQLGRSYAVCVGGLTPEQRAELIVFLTTTVTGGMTDDELFELWVDSGADELPRPKVVREYHIALVQILEDLPSKT